MKLKRMLSMLGASAMVIGMLAGCASSESSSDSTGSGVSNSAESTFPEKDITIIVPWGVGGGGDLIARKAAETIEKNVDVNVIVENDTGASGTIGMTDAFEADADGYTIVWAGGSAYAVTPQFIDVSYTFEDFYPIHGARSSSQDIIANPNASGIDSFDAIKSVGATRPITVATGAVGNEGNILAQAMLSKLGVDYEIIVYDSQSDMTNAVAGGQVDLALVASPTWWEFAKTGEITGLATLDPNGTQGTPSGDLKSLEELGVDISYIGYDFFACRADVPDDVKEKLVSLFDAAFEDEDFIAYMDELGFPIYNGHAEEITEYTEGLIADFEEYIPLAVK